MPCTRPAGHHVRLTAAVPGLLAALLEVGGLDTLGVTGVDITLGTVEPYAEWRIVSARDLLGDILGKGRFRLHAAKIGGLRREKSPTPCSQLVAAVGVRLYSEVALRMRVTSAILHLEFGVIEGQVSRSWRL